MRNQSTPRRRPVSREYAAWQTMLQGCTNPHSAGWRKYGSRGIRVCARWSGSFAAFLADMGTSPRGFALVLWPNTDGNFEPNNCRWAETPRSRSRARPADRLTVGDGLCGEWQEIDTVVTNS